MYVVGAWVVIEVSSVFFPAWGIPDTALRYLFVAAAALFPVVILFGWLFDVKRSGLYRTVTNTEGQPAPARLRRQDFVVLSGLTGITVAVLLVEIIQVWNSIDGAPVNLKDVERTENSVAILPFDNLDTNPDTGYFSDGVTEEILHRLSSIRAIHVLGRNSSFAFRNSNLALSEISKLLAVEYLLEGSVRRDGDLVRVTARLTDQSGAQIWSETFDRKLEAIFAIQSEIAGAVSKRIAHEIVSTGGSSIGRTTASMEAFDEYLLGRKHAHDRIPGWHAKAREAFRRALELDPDYAPAHAGLAYAQVINAPDVTEESLENAIGTARRSIDLDPDLAEGHAILGLMVASNFSDRFDEGIAHLRRALELDPTFSDTYNWLSLLLADNGQYEEAELMMERGHAVDPLLPSITANLADRLSNAGDLERALRILERHTRLPELTNPIQGGLTQANFEWGRYVEALRWIEDPESALIFEALGLRDEADNRLEGFEPTGPFGLFGLVLNSRHSRGEHRQALEIALTSLSQQGRDLRQIGSEFGVPLLVTQVAAGAYDESIQLFESMFDADPAALSQATWSLEGQDALNALAFAFQQTGNAAKAAELLAYRDERIARLEPLASPHFLEPMALNAALRGDGEKAYALLSRAVDLGWANYYRTINDPRWGDTLRQPRFVALLERVQENLAKQRSEVEAMLAAQSEN